MNGLENKKRTAYFEYDFAKHGGAAGNINITGSGIPVGAIINNGIIRVKTAVTGGAAFSIALRAVGANDIKTATTAASWAANALLPTVPVGTAATSKRVTATVGAINKLIMTVVTGLTAGKFVVALDYWMTE
jgi:hypothetical protein